MCTWLQTMVPALLAVAVQRRPAFSSLPSTVTGGSGTTLSAGMLFITNTRQQCRPTDPAMSTTCKLYALLHSQRAG